MILSSYERSLPRSKRPWTCSGAIALNGECDKETAELIVKNYAEVVIAPEFAEGVMDLFAKKKNLRRGDALVFMDFWKYTRFGALKCRVFTISVYTNPDGSEEPVLSHYNFQCSDPKIFGPREHFPPGSS